MMDQETERDKEALRRLNKKQFFSHLLVGRIKDSNVMFSFIVKISLVEQEQMILPGAPLLQK